MTILEIESYCRLYVPGASINVISQPGMWKLINKGVEDINQRLKVYRKYKKFDIVSGKTDYKINTEIADDFVCMDESGVYYYDGSNWQQVFPKTIKWLDDNFSNWRSYAATNRPQYYAVNPNKLTLFPSYNTNVTEGGWIYYIGKPVNMTDGSQYPWTGSSSDHITELDCLDDGIIAYVQWKLAQPLGQKANGVIDKKEYEDRLDKCEEILHSRIDMSNSRYFRMRGPVSCSGSGSR